jgi:hypothetical protein
LLQPLRQWWKEQKIRGALRRLGSPRLNWGHEYASARHALEQLGPDTIPALRRAWEKGSADEVEASARGLAMLGAEGARHLRELLRDATPQTRRQAVRGLNDIIKRFDWPSVIGEENAALVIDEARRWTSTLETVWERAPNLVRAVLKKVLTGGTVGQPGDERDYSVWWAMHVLEELRWRRDDEIHQVLLEAFREAAVASRREIVREYNNIIKQSHGYRIYAPHIGLFKVALSSNQDSEVLRLAAVGLQVEIHGGAGSTFPLADLALDELKEALWVLDAEVCRQAAIALSKSRKGQHVLAGECRIALVDLISMRKTLFSERALPRIEGWLSRPQVSQGDEVPLRDLLERVRDADQAARLLTTLLAPTDQELTEFLQPRGLSALSEAVGRQGLSMLSEAVRRSHVVDFAAEVFALHKRLVEVLMDWEEARTKFESRQRSWLLARFEGRRRSWHLARSAALRSSERFIFFHDNREYQDAIDAWPQADGPIEMTPEVAIERYLDCLGHLGRKEEYWDRLGGRADHPQVLHKRRDVTWAAFCRRAVAAIGWVRVRDPSWGTSSGTGFCIGPDLMVTCRHVLQAPKSRQLVDREQIRILFPGDVDDRGTGDDSGPGRRVLTIIDHFEGQFDAVLLRIDGPSPAWFRLGYSALVERGDEVAVLGYSMPDPGLAADHNLEFHAGKVSNLEPIMPHLVDAMKVGVEVGPGMSGAPVCNELGEAIGLLTLANPLTIGGSGVLIERLALLIDPVREAIAPRNNRPISGQGADMLAAAQT